MKKEWSYGCSSSRRRFLSLAFLLLFGLAAGCGKTEGKSAGKLRVGFDIDDTLLFSTPAFMEGEKSGYRYGSQKYWEVVNGADCDLSIVKKKVLEIVKEHQKNGDEIFVLTAREGHNGEPVKECIEKKFGIPKKNVYFEPDRKVDRIRKLKIDIYYGDSDSDIEDAREAGAEGIRIERNPKSSYKKKYNPGKFGEKVIPDSKN